MKLSHSIIAVALAVAAQNVLADSLELKNGTVLDGKYAGGTASTIRFETSSGVQTVETAQVTALKFTAAPATAAAPAAAPGNTVTLPAGTTLLVRTVDPLSSQNQAGTTFSARLETDLSAGNVVAVKGGTMIYGKVQSSTQARRAVGQSTIDLRLTQLVVNGKQVPIGTSGYQQAGERSGAKAARGAAAGAAVGAVAGDAGKGAAVGATVGAARRGQTISIPAGTLLEFTLTQPITITP